MGVMEIMGLRFWKKLDVMHLTDLIFSKKTDVMQTCVPVLLSRALSDSDRRGGTQVFIEKKFTSIGQSGKV